jgi:hypothetical protein
MLFMVIERFRDRDPIPVYKRVRDQGIKFPERLTYVGSWIELAELRPLFPADGMRRRAAAPGMGAELLGARHDFRDRTRRAEQGNPRSRRAVSGLEIAHRSGKSLAEPFASGQPCHRNPFFSRCILRGRSLSGH